LQVQGLDDKLRSDFTMQISHNEEWTALKLQEQLQTLEEKLLSNVSGADTHSATMTTEDSLALVTIPTDDIEKQVTNLHVE